MPKKPFPRSSRLATAWHLHWKAPVCMKEARLRADREQAISQIATAISSSSGYEEILQTTVREIGMSLRDTEVSIQILDQTKENKQSA